MRTIPRPTGEQASHVEAPRPAVRLFGATIRRSPWVVIAVALHVVAILAIGAVRVANRAPERSHTKGILVLGERSADEGGEGLPSLELIDRNAIPRSSESREEGPVNPDEIIIPDAAADRRGEFSDNADPNHEPGEFNADPSAPADVPSGATGGTSLGVARVGHFEAGQPSAFVSRRIGAGGSGGGGLGSGGGGGSGGHSSRPEPGTWKRSTLLPNTTRLRVGDTETLPLDAVEASIRVDGPRARVVLDCLFRNDRERTLEGTFELRLPNEASPFYFAFGESARAVATTGPASERAPFLGTTAASIAATAVDGIASARADAWSAPKEARMVPRERAAWAYTESTRRRVDPALVEWAGAGVFSARVFPLAPGRTHRVVFAYDVDLVATGDGQELRFDLPSDAPQRAVAIDVDADERPTLTPYAARSAADGRVVYSFKNPTQNAIVLHLANPDPAVLVGTDAAVGPCFATALTPQIPSATAAPGATRGVFLLDTSLSSNPERFNVWLKLVRAVLDENRASLREFDVLFFDVQTRWWRDGFVANTPQNVDALLEDAQALSLEGATDLAAALAEASAPTWLRATADAPRHDLFLLSDGAATWGATETADLDAALAKGRGGFLWAYETGLAGTDSTTLAHLARATGGAVFSVTGESEIAAAARAHAQRPCVLRGVSIEGGADVLVAGRPTVVHPGQRLRIAGRGAPKDGAPVVLKLEQDGRAFEVRTSPTRVVRSDLATRAYGQIAVAQIEELGAVAGSPARAYATHFRVVGSTCSLLMLESEADYQRYGIHPDEDAARIKWEHASDFVSRFGDARRNEPSNARADLVAWLHRLESTPGMQLRVPEELLAAVGRMSAASFRVEAPRLVCRSLLKSDVPAELRVQLASHSLDYDALAAESKRRLAVAGPADALRAMSSLVENLPGDTALARDVAYSALEWGLAGQAVHLFRRVATLRPYEPETYRALADALQRTGDADLAIVYSEIALAGNFDARFGGFREVAALDYVRMLRRIQRGELVTSVPDFAAERLAALTRDYVPGDQGLVVVITWNTDRTDVDLHVTDPRGEECFYQHTRTAIGGTITRDVTQGFGPEMFRVAKPVAGDYAVRVHYFASDNQRASVRSQVLATIYERWGQPDEKVTRKAVTLTAGQDRWAPIATVHLDADAK
jgi:uncharacterized membrane protein YgcG